MYSCTIPNAVKLACGGSTSVNNSYIVQSGGSSFTCGYQVCPCSTDICRIRYDFIVINCPFYHIFYWLKLFADPHSGFTRKFHCSPRSRWYDSYTKWYYRKIELLYPFSNTCMLFSDFAVGDCTTDQFSITSPGRFGSPIICGTNTGQHSESIL